MTPRLNGAVIKKNTILLGFQFLLHGEQGCIRGVAFFTNAPYFLGDLKGWRTSCSPRSGSQEGELATGPVASCHCRLPKAIVRVPSLGRGIERLPFPNSSAASYPPSVTFVSLDGRLLAAFSGLIFRIECSATLRRKIRRTRGPPAMSRRVRSNWSVRPVGRLVAQVLTTTCVCL